MRSDLMTVGMPGAMGGTMGTDSTHALPPAAPRADRLVDQIRVVGRVVTALVLRETKTRFGKNRFGYIFALIEPLAFVAVFVVIRAAISTSTPFGESIVLFVISGLLIYRVFLAISGRLSSAITANKALLTYPPVKPTDVLFARFLLELLTMYAVVGIVFFGLSLTAEREILIDVPNFAAALVATTVLGAGIGVFNAIAFILVPIWGLIYPMLRLPLLLTSGVFYVPLALPPFAQDILWWNPILHCVEWTRTGTYLTYEPMLDKWYPLTVAAVALVAGLGLERLYRFKVLNA